MKNPLVLQQEITECGLACIAMILKHFKSRVDLNYLRQKFNVSIRGTSLSELVKIAQQLKLTSLPYLLKPDQVNTLETPAILYWESNHYVVLYKIDKRKGYYILDPAKGCYWVGKESLQKHFSSFALVLKPDENYVPFKQENSSIYRKLFNALPTMLGYLGITILVTLLLQLVVLLFPACIQRMILPSDVQFEWNQVVTLTAIILVLFKVCESIIYFIRSRVISKLEQVIAKSLSLFIFNHLLHLPLDYFEKRSQSTIFTRFNSIEKIRETLSRGLAESLIDGIFSISTLLFLYSYNVNIGLLVSVISVIYLLFNYYLSQISKSLNLIQINERARESAKFVESIRGIIPIKIASCEDKSIKQWFNQYLKYLSSSEKINFIQSLLESIRIFLFGIKITMVMYIAVKLVAVDKLALGELYAILFYLNLYIKNISGITSKLFDVRLCMTHVKNLGDIVMSKVEPTNDVRCETSNGTIRLENISFRYHENSPCIIRNFNLSIHPGSCVVLFGPSGIGKTTLLKILIGLITPTSGHVYFNDTLITKDNIRWYRKQIAGVMQDDSLFTGSIYKNISFFDEMIDYETVNRCAKIAGIDEDISKMPMGYDSYLGDMGVSISGGQKQRILLARALYKNTNILFLDEAFNHLDIPTETKLNNVLKELQKTRIIITHRTEPLVFADHIVDLKTYLNQHEQ